METVVFKPSFNAFTFHTISTIGGPVISSRNHSLFKSANYAKTRKFSSSVSLTSPQKGKSPNCDRRNVNSLFKRFWVFFRAFRIKSAQELGLTLTQKLVSKTQACGETEGVIDGTGFLQNGGIAVALLSVTSSAKVNISPIAAKLAANPTFVAGVLAWFVAQSCKVVLNFFVEKTWDLRILFACGGMPSSHSALCTALTTSVALCHGVADSLFPVCLGFSLIVMYDAIGVRRHAGMQAQVLNLIVEDLFQGHPIRCRKLKELLGHTPLQVFAGALLGFVVAVICHWGCLISI